jgi:polyphosphate kinase 2 (PPK2 family)
MANKSNIEPVKPGSSVRLADHDPARHTHKLLLVLQGMDTAGKDGTIRHVFKTVDPLGVRVASFKAPTPAESGHDFLWRVHGWIDADECKRRYAQIGAFERMLAETGTIILKCFLHISKDEQRSRLQARLDDPTKRWKFNPVDLEEREFWDEYMQAYEDALAATATQWAP